MNGESSFTVVAPALAEEQSEPEEPSFTAVETDPNGRYTRYDQILGRGAFKTVYKAFDETEGLEVAWNQVKVNDMDVSSSSVERERLFAEIRVLKQLKHKNIMSFYDSWLDSKNMTVNFVTELFTSGTLRQYRKKRKVLDDNVLKRWAWQILQGLVYLHGHNPPIIHRDLKCDNIFVNGASGVIKLGDLGLATLWRGLTAPQSVLGTPEFMAPELYEEKYNEKVDVYSFGMCMLELSTMEYPYAECKNAAQIYRKVTQGVLPGGLAKVEDQALREFIELCIGHDPEQRPEARQLLKHSFFESIRTGKMSCPGVDKAICERNFEDEPPEGSSSSDEAAFAPPCVKTNELAQEVKPGRLVSLQVIPYQPNPQPGAGPGSGSGQRVNGAGVGEVHTPSLSVVGTPDRRPSPPPPPTGEVSPRAGSSAAEERPAGCMDPLVTQLLASHEGSHEERDRDFFVCCRQVEATKLSFQLNFMEPVGGCKTIEFAFDLHEDTADAIAHEMMEDLSLSALEAQNIATKIRQEIQRIAGSRPSIATEADGATNGVHDPPAAVLRGQSVPTPFQHPAAAVATRISQINEQHQSASLGSAPPSFSIASTATDAPAVSAVSSDLASRRTSSAGQVARSESHTPPENIYGNKPPSIHHLIAAMKEVHQQEEIERLAAEAPKASY